MQGIKEKEKRELDSHSDLQCLAARVLACGVLQRLCSSGCSRELKLALH